jgi:micrococcal nuclease
MKRTLLVALLVLTVAVTGCVGQPSETDPSPGDTDGVETEEDAPVADSAEESPERNDSTPASSGASGDEVVVTHVIDGDTFDIQYQDGREDTVRLVGVDTPEVYSEVSPEEFGGANAVCLDDWADRATSFVEDSIEDEDVRIGFDENEGRRGYYDRLLAYAYTEETHLNHQLVEQGYGRVYTDSEFSKKDGFLEAQREARENNRGLWGCSTESSSCTGTDGAPVERDEDMDCGDFETQAEAQRLHETHTGHRLDGDGDGIACEALP